MTEEEYEMREQDTERKLCIERWQEFLLAKARRIEMEKTPLFYWKELCRTKTTKST